jgi:hypothetical protein
MEQSTDVVFCYMCIVHALCQRQKVGQRMCAENSSASLCKTEITCVLIVITVELCVKRKSRDQSIYRGHSSGHKQLHRIAGTTQSQETPPSSKRLLRTGTSDEVAGMSSSLGLGD